MCLPNPLKKDEATSFTQEVMEQLCSGEIEKEDAVYRLHQLTSNDNVLWNIVLPILNRRVPCFGARLEFNSTPIHLYPEQGILPKFQIVALRCAKHMSTMTWVQKSP